MLLRKGLKNEKHTHHSKVYYDLKSQWGRRKMAFELIYLYIDDIGRNIKQCGIPFSNRFEVIYDGDEKNIFIEKKDPGVGFFYGENIQDIKLLVGKNGCGKSTVMDLLGTTDQDRKREFPMYEKDEWPFDGKVWDLGRKYSWFAVYHLNGDDFVIEGYHPELLDKITEQVCLRDDYSIAIAYDFEKHRVSQLNFLQEKTVDRSRKADEAMFYLFYQVEPAIHWLTQPQRLSKDRYNCTFERQYVGKNGFQAINSYLYRATHEQKFQEEMNSSIGVEIEIGLKSSGIKSLDVENVINERTSAQHTWMLEKTLYQGKEQLLDIPVPKLRKILNEPIPYSDKECIILEYLEELIWNILKKGDAKAKQSYDPPKVENNYLYRKQFLLEFLKQLVQENAEKEYLSVTVTEEDYQIAQKICEGIEQIPDGYCQNAQTIRIPVRDMEKNFTDVFMCAMDANSLEEHLVQHRNIIDVKFRHLSSGEAFYLDLYAALYRGVQKMEHQKEGDTCILLLDEPDSRFHPEWSRRFIKNLTEELKKEMFRKFRYQIIISTHSPLLLSDVRREDIICMNTDGKNGSVRIEKSPYGFMSNINDILLDTFFLEAPYGAWAENYVNKLLEKISQLGQEIKGNANTIPKKKTTEEFMKRIECLEKEVNKIGEELIRSSLLKKLHRYYYQIQSQKMQKNQEEETRREEIRYLKERLARLEQDD